MEKPPSTTALREENGRLRKNNEELRAQSACAQSARCDGEVESLKDEITRSRRAEEQWRQAYVESRKGRRPEDEPVRIGSVRDAVALAREAFPDRLLIKLNTSSNEDTPFTNPSEVYDALAWLATAHRDANDKRIGEACSGWSFKKDQVENSIAKYREQYETVTDGKTWCLGAHVGKGTRWDPRYTIRIGFARDEENNRVVVGFIGQHAPSRKQPELEVETLPVEHREAVSKPIGLAVLRGPYAESGRPHETAAHRQPVAALRIQAIAGRKAAVPHPRHRLPAPQRLGAAPRLFRPTTAPPSP